MNKPAPRPSCDVCNAEASALYWVRNRIVCADCRGTAPPPSAPASAYAAEGSPICCRCGMPQHHLDLHSVCETCRAEGVTP